MKSFKAVFKKIEKSVKTSQKQALKTATVAARAMYAKEVSAELGIKSARAKGRSYLDVSEDSASVNILTRTMFNAHEFSPGKVKTKTVMGNRYTATYKVKGGSKITLPGSFLTSVSNTSTTKKLILQRASGAKYPTKTTVVNVFKPAVEAMQPRLQKRMVESFTKTFNDKLKFNMSK